MTSAQVVESLATLGVPFTEASLRKWVQLSLLPKSDRVASPGAQGGSRGVYPVSILRRVLAVKRLLAEGWSSESIVSRGLLFEHDLEDLEGRLEQVISGMERGFGGGRDASTLEPVRRELREARTREAPGGEGRRDAPRGFGARRGLTVVGRRVFVTSVT
jgi:hypothetical protein